MWIRTETGVVTGVALVLLLMARIASSDAAIGVPWHLSGFVQLVIGYGGLAVVTAWVER